MANDSVARTLAVALSGGGGGEPAEYLKDAEVDGETLVLTKKDGTEVEFTPSGEPELYIKNAVVSGETLTLTKQDDSTVSFENTDTTYTAGTNVSISAGNVISATDTTYSAGTNVSISNNVISATDTTYSAGTGITLNGTTISADTTTMATQDYVDEAIATAIGNAIEGGY